MKFERKFYTQDEAAEKLGRSSGDVYYLVKTEQLPVCFDARGELFNVTIQHPDGSIEYLPKELAVPINGVLKSLLPPVDQDILQASSVQIIQVGDRQCRHVPGPKVSADKLPVPKLVADNSQIPTTNDPEKFVQPGFVVKGWVDFVDVQVSDWLFHIDDLLALEEMDSATSVQSEPTPTESESPEGKESVTPPFRPKIGWQVALFEAWPAMRKFYGRDPSASNAIRYIKKNDKSGYILPKGGDTELWWKPARTGAKEVQFKTVENCISEWKTRGQLPA